MANGMQLHNPFAQYPAQTVPMTSAAAPAQAPLRAADSVMGSLSSLLGARADDCTDPLLRRLRQIDELDGLGDLFRMRGRGRSRSRGSGRSKSSRASRRSTASTKKKDTEKKKNGKKKKKANKKDDDSSSEDTSSSSKSKKSKKKKKKRHGGDNRESDAGHREG